MWQTEGTRQGRDRRRSDSFASKSLTESLHKQLTDELCRDQVAACLEEPENDGIVEWKARTTGCRTSFEILCLSSPGSRVHCRKAGI